MYLLISCVFFSWPVVVIFLYLFCSYHIQVIGGCSTICFLCSGSHSHYVTEGTQSLHFSNIIYIKTIRFYKVTFYQYLC